MNEHLDPIFMLLVSFASDRWYAICFFVVIFILAYFLCNQFHSKATMYTMKTPKEAMLLNLLCRRWERHSNQVMGGILITFITAFIMYLMIEMGKEVLNAQATLPNLTQELNLVAYSETLIYVFIFSISSMMLKNAYGAFSDLKESDL